MTDEKKPDTVVEMTPGDDGTKVPLTNQSPAEEAKFVANPNGDAKIDLGKAPTFTGLNKEELQKYSNDPFWVKLRWALFILFWVAWAAMLVMAIVIIVQAPGCEPPPVRLWVEEGAIYQVDTSNLPKHDVLIEQMTSLGVKSAYLPGLIKEEDFSMSNYLADSLIEGLSTAGKGVITDLPTRIPPENVVFANASKAGVIDPQGNFLYSHANLSSILAEFALSTWMNRGVKGFLMGDTDTDDKKMFKQQLNGIIMENGGGVGSDVINMKDEMPKLASAAAFQQFLEEHAGNWSYYKFNPHYEVTSELSSYQVRLMNIAMFLFEGTPILQDFSAVNLTTSTARDLNELSQFRTHDGIKFGVVNFLNNTQPDIVAYTRVQKGTPAYAVALNFGTKDSTVDFSLTPNIAEEGNVQFDSEPNSLNDNSDLRRKVQLNSVAIKGLEGLVIQFVATF